MPGNEDLQGSSLDPTGTLSSGRGVGSTASQEEHSDDRSVDVDARPPLGVKLTVYRLLNMTIMTYFCFATVTGILTYKGLSTVPTTVDWVSGGVLAVVLYWIGFYERQHSKKWEWFFQFDLAPAICYCTRRAVGGALWALFDKNLFIISLDVSMSGLVGGLPYCFLSTDYSWGISFGTAFFLLGFQYCLNALATYTQQFQARAWATGFVIDYGPGAPRAARYGWFGVVGTIVGLFCGIALAGLPVVVAYITFNLTCPRTQTTP